MKVDKLLTVMKIDGYSEEESFAITQKIEYMKMILNNPPRKSDIRETKDILKDFCINEKIPAFEKLSQLHRWRKDIISKNLDKVMV